MAALTRFLKRLLPIGGEPALPTTCFELTLHDAIRMAQAHRAAPAEPAAVPQSDRSETIDVCSYRSESDLRDLWHRYDNAGCCGALTIVLMLNGSLPGSLSGLVRRCHPASKLILVPRSGHWPGIDSIGDLAMASGALGWQTIEVRRDSGDALASVCASLGVRHRLLVLLPAAPNGRAL